ncbi:MAG: single-stranded-DNA-specific exonuclease, single-stranded-DNA-specific exonuclease [Bacteroidota bacterium]
MKRYEIRENIPENVSKKLSKYPELIQKLLYYRGIEDLENAENFFNPNYETDLHDPFLLPNMSEAVERILLAIKENQRVTIYSDYDADGIPASVALHDFFKKIGFENFDVYIPHRNKEGFGLNEKAIREIHSRGTNLMITIDCGTADFDEVALARELGMDVIITDHHEAHEKIPDAIIVNHKLPESNYPERILCGAGVVFKLIQALIQKGDFDLPKGFEKWFLDVVGIATMADMVPLVGENRAIAHYGLVVLRKSSRPGLQQLFKKTRLDQNKISAMDVGFTIAPRINAASRMGEPHTAFYMLSERDIGIVSGFVEHLHKINDQRKGHVASITKHVYQKFDDWENFEDLKVIVAGNPDWQPSLLGLAASNIVEKYKRPVFLWGRGDGDELKGSCRSIDGVSTLNLLNEVSDILDHFGGHDQAGGFAVNSEHVDFLLDRLNEAYNKSSFEDQDKVIFIDSEISVSDINYKMFDHIQKIGPFGVGNEEPKFLIKNIFIKDIQKFGKNKEHLKVVCFQDGKTIEAISFYSDEESFSNKVNLNEKNSLVCTIEKNQWGGGFRLRILDFLN